MRKKTSTYVVTILRLFRDSRQKQNIFLVGGFAASEYLFSKLQEHLEAQGLKLSRPDSHTYAHPLFFLAIDTDEVVGVRPSPKAQSLSTSTTSCLLALQNSPTAPRSYDLSSPTAPTISSACSRVSSTSTGSSALEIYSILSYVRCVLYHVSRCIASDLREVVFDLKGTQVSETTEFERAYHQLRRKSNVHKITTRIISYKGNNVPYWMDVQPGVSLSFNCLYHCRVYLNISLLCLTRRSILGTMLCHRRRITCSQDSAKRPDGEVLLPELQHRSISWAHGA